jgi:hypothetical protein
MPARLVCESEESEEDEGTGDQRPTEKFDENMSQGVGFPRNARDLDNSSIMMVVGGQARPRDKTRLNVDGKNPRC